MQLTNVSAEIMIKIVYIPEAYLEHSQISTMKFFPKKVNGLYPLTIFVKELHRRCSTGF